MSDIVELPAQPRERAGKGPARATRRTGRVPGVIYGAKKDPNLISVEERLLTKLMHQGDRKREVEGKSGSRRVDLGGCSIIKKQKHIHSTCTYLQYHKHRNNH